MSMTMLYGSVPDLIANDIHQWRTEHPTFSLYYSHHDVQPPVTGLFDVGNTGVEVHVDTITVAVADKIVAEIGKDTDILIVSAHKSRANFVSRGYKVIDRSIPGSQRGITDEIVRLYGITPTVASQCVERAHKPLSAFIMARQASLCTSDVDVSDLYDPFRGDTPPWDIVDAIVSGRPDKAIRAVNIALTQGAKPVDVMFQLIGMFTKVIAFGNDTGGIVDNSKTRFYAPKSRALVDPHGLAEDMSLYPDIIMEAGQFKDYALTAMVVSMASRFTER